MKTRHLILTAIILISTMMLSGCFNMGGNPNNYLGGDFAKAAPPSSTWSTGPLPVVLPLESNYQSLYQNVFLTKCQRCHN